MGIEAVIFDLGGVVLDSPLSAFAEYEHELGLAPHALSRAVVEAGSASAWARLERGELSMEEFYLAFDAENQTRGTPISARTLMARVADNTQLRPAVVTAIRTIRAAGLKTAALTNSWVSADQNQKIDALRAEFDVFVESAREGLRKPDPRIYMLACTRLRSAPNQVAFLDDIGLNLKPARDLGMTTIKVGDYRVALQELGELLGLVLVAR
ncbi:MAG TPA: HAD family phosphatase [Polyangiales bacterium]